MVKEEKFNIVARTFQGLEEVLANEIREMGAEEISVLKRAVAFRGDLEMLYKTNFCCRTALNILVPIHEFIATGPDDLYRNLLKFDWDRYMDIKKSFLIKATIHSSLFTHSRFVVHRVKDAISDFFVKKTMLRPSVDRENPDIIFNIHVNHNKCSLSIDSSGEPLFKRGYRVEQGDAPLNEILAAGLVLLSGWDGKEDLYDVMCGSGTILIEAGLIGLNIPPGSFRDKFGFSRWKIFDENLFEHVRKESMSKVNENPSFALIGNDIHRHMTLKTIKNMKRAGLSRYNKMYTGSAFDFEPKTNSGKIIINPPYGERIKDDDIVHLYRQLGTLFKNNFTGFEAWILSSNIEALKHVGLKPSFKTTLFNGPLECKYQKYELYEGSKKMKDLY